MSDTERVLRELKRGRVMTSLKAAQKMFIMNLPDIIGRLKKRGYVIDALMVTRNGKRFAEYRLNREMR